MWMHDVKRLAKPLQQHNNWKFPRMNGKFEHGIIPAF